LYIGENGFQPKQNKINDGGFFDLDSLWGWARVCTGCCKCMPQPKCCAIQGGKKISIKVVQ